VTDADRKPFAVLLSQALAFYRQDVSEFALGVWWAACQPFDLEQVRKALTAHALDAERGRFAPKPADIVRELQGTVTDRSLVAWGKVLEAMRVVGAYRSVAFDDAAIHSAIEDIGGWVAICRTALDELPHLQRRFCESHRVYSRRPAATHRPHLPGEFEATNALNGRRIDAPTLIGDESAARAVMLAGSSAPRIGITPASQALALEAAR
jgi:hypothetical protein